MCLSSANEKIINDLITGFSNLNKSERFLFPSKVKSLLKQHDKSDDKAQNALDMIRAIMSVTWKSTYACLKTFSESPLYKTCLLLKRHQLSSAVYAQSVLGHPMPSRLFSAVRILDENQLLDNDYYFTAVTNHPESARLAKAFIILQENNMVSDIYCRAVKAQDKDPTTVALILKRMHFLGLLQGMHALKNYEALLAHSDPSNLLLGIETLEMMDEERQEKFEIIVHSTSSYTEALMLIQSSNLSQFSIHRQKKLDSESSHSQEGNAFSYT